MKDFFKGVRKRIDRLDASQLREQYGLVADELANSDMIFHAMSEGILVLDRTGGVRQSNPAARRLLGMDPADCVPTLALPLGKASKREIALTYPDPRVLELKTIPMGDDTLVFIRDISAERQRSEEELRAGATRAVCDLAAGVAHEIGNPLNAISLNIQMLERDPTDKEAIAICKSQIRRLDGIIRDFLSALRPSRPNLSAGSIVDPLKACIQTLGGQFEERRIAVTLDVPATPPPVALDRNQMEQVFFNLLKNALEAMKDGGTIAMCLSSDDNNVSVSIRDSGEGMDAERLAHLFEPYRTSKEHGTGLGLMITKRIVTDHGGTIAAESKVGEGTTFTVTLPRLERRVRALK